MQKFKVEAPQRLDIFLSQILQKSRSQVATFIKTAKIKVQQKEVNKPGFMLKINDEVEIKDLNLQDENLNLSTILSTQGGDLNLNENLNENLNLKAPQNSGAQKENSKEHARLEILFEDEDILVINKPPNLVVHSAPSVKETTLVDILLAQNYALSNLSGQMRAGLVHRLDKGTSGALIIAKNNQAHANLSKQLESRSLGRIYLALCDLPLKESFMRVEKALIRAPSNRLKKLALNSNENAPKHAKTAISSFINLLTSDKNKTALIAAKLFTGRTHQIRAHLESLNRHILGDALYHYKGSFKGRVMLHSRLLSFFHPKSQKKLVIKAPFYDDFYKILKTHFTQGEIDEKSSTEYLCKLFTECL